MAGAREAFARRRAEVFDSLVEYATERAAALIPASPIIRVEIAPSAEASPVAMEKAMRDAILHHAPLTEQDAALKSWQLVAKGLRHLRDYFTAEAQEQTVAYAAHKASMRNAMAVPGALIVPPPLGEAARFSLPMSNAVENARASSVRMIDLAEDDIPHSREVIRDIIRMNTPEALPPRLDDPGEIGADALGFRNAFLKTAEKLRLSPVQAEAVAVHMRLSLDLLERSYMRVCQEFRREIGHEKLVSPPVPPRPLN